MKKTLSLLLALLLSSVPVYGLAADRCTDHPNAVINVVIHDDDNGRYTSEEYSMTKHKRLAELWVCSVCHKRIKEEYIFELHEFSGNICWCCEYERPSKGELRNKASNLIYQNKIYNHGCWIMYSGSLYSSPDSSSRQLGSLAFGEGYYVDAYQQDGNNIWIQIKKLPSESPIGWVNAEILGIDEKSPEPVGDSSIYVGRTIRITTSSGRGRADAGTEFPYLETVHYGEKYTILDAKTGTNGNAWYKIRVDGREVWISSGLGTLE